MDYTKGLVARLKALEVLFSKYPQWKQKVTFLQVAVPSRTDVKEYQDLKRWISDRKKNLNKQAYYK